uniref:Centlein, centrosomal protein n=1 Tax=Tetraodon nigroviridis TaxID=99883 RepID=H3D0D5_TETNG
FPVCECRHDYADVQTLYRQSAGHTAEQSQLIKQLEGLNLDTQKVLRNQEEAHTADTSSYQTLFFLLYICLNWVLNSTALIRQEPLCSPAHLINEEQPCASADTAAHTFECKTLGSSQGSDPRPADQTLHRRSASSVRRQALANLPLQQYIMNNFPVSNRTTKENIRHLSPSRSKKPLALSACNSCFQEAPVLRSRSLSPANSVELGSGKRREAEQRIQDLEELLQLKIEENEELRKAHDNRRERICVIKTNYKTVRDQLRELEKSHFLPGGKLQRAEPWQLRQENSDAVWNELAYFKNLTRKLTIEKTSLEEELDMQRVQAAMDRATVKELHLCLTEEHKELLHKVEKESQVNISTPKKASVSSGRIEQSIKKVQHFNIITSSFTANERSPTESQLQKMLHHSSRSQLAAAQKEATQLQQQLLKLRQDLGILKASRDFYKNCAAGQAQTVRIASNISESKRRSLARMIERRGKPLSDPLKYPAHQFTRRCQMKMSAIKASLCSFPCLPRASTLKFCTAGRQQTILGRSALLFLRKHFENLSVEGAVYLYDSPGSSRHAMSQTKGFISSLLSARHGVIKPGTDQILPDPIYKEVNQGFQGVISVLSSVGSEFNSCFSCRSLVSLLIQSYSCSLLSSKEAPARVSNRTQPSGYTQGKTSFTLFCKQRIESQRRHIDVLRSAKEDAVLSAKELHRANERIREQLSSLTEKLSSSKQLTQKTMLQLLIAAARKKVGADLLTKVRSRCPFCSLCSSLWQHVFNSIVTPNVSPQTLEAEVKQLQAKVKSTSAEVTKQVAANKALRGQLQEKEDKLRQLQEKASHAERDANMKRQLVEDLKTRLKFLQEMEKSYRGQVEDLEKKVKTLSEEATNRKALIESLKRRLNVTTSEKDQCEASCTKLKEDVEKKDQRVQTLLARLGASEKALAELEKTATDKMEGLAQQSSSALDKLQRQLSQASSQLEQFHFFIKGLASEILLDVQEVKQHLMRRRRRQRQASSVAAQGGLSAKSVIRAKSIAASILNMSENDLADIMDTDQYLQATEAHSESVRDQEWLDHFNRILQ